MENSQCFSLPQRLVDEQPDERRNAIMGQETREVKKFGPIPLEGGER
jgi:hypothetical protein